MKFVEDSVQNYCFPFERLNSSSHKTFTRMENWLDVSYERSSVLRNSIFFIFKYAKNRSFDAWEVSFYDTAHFYNDILQRSLKISYHNKILFYLRTFVM